MKILLLDIETSPNTAYVWGLWNENINLQRLIDSSSVLCWAAKWLGDDHIYFGSTFKDGPKRMMKKIHKLIDEADAIVHYNGTKFDIPTLNKEFLLFGMEPPAPYKQVDLLKVARNKFKFPSNKLDYVAKALGVGGKVSHKGFQLWIDCMNRVPEAWVQMEEYNKNDVVILEGVYKKLLPWIKTHPNASVYDNGLVCPNCGSPRHHRRGHAITSMYKYPRYQCIDCGNWFRGNKVEEKTTEERYINV